MSITTTTAVTAGNDPANTTSNSFDARATLQSGEKGYTYYRLDSLAQRGIELSRLPFSLRVLLENLLRREDGVTVTADDIEFLAKWQPMAEPSREIAYMPARVLMQDFTGVPAIVDLAAMRDAMKLLGGDPEKINPLQPAELVIDHSVQVDEYGLKNAYDLNSILEFQRNRERYAFLKWGQTAFRNFSAGAARHGHLPPGEPGVPGARRLHHAGTTRPTRTPASERTATPPWSTAWACWAGASAALRLRRPCWGSPSACWCRRWSAFASWASCGRELPRPTGADCDGDAAQARRRRQVCRVLRQRHQRLPLADRATIANMAPEYGATLWLLPGGCRNDDLPAPDWPQRRPGAAGGGLLPRAGACSTPPTRRNRIQQHPVAGPRHGGAKRRRTKRPQDRVLLSETKQSFAKVLPTLYGPNANVKGDRQLVRWGGEGGHASADGSIESSVAAPEPGKDGHLTLHDDPIASVRERLHVDVDPFLHHGSIVIAAITSCTNTSNPYVMMAAGLLAKKAVRKACRRRHGSRRRWPPVRAW